MICILNQKQIQSDVRKFNNRFVFYVLSLPLCCITDSDIDSSRI